VGRRDWCCGAGVVGENTRIRKATSRLLQGRSEGALLPGAGARPMPHAWDVIIGLGFDLVSVARIAELLATDDTFVTRTFTASERDACADRGDRAQALAARLAAKEACLKALGTGWGPGVSFAQVEVVGGDGVQPRLRLSGGAAAQARALAVERWHVTLTHDGGFAAAAVIAEGREVSPPDD